MATGPTARATKDLWIMLMRTCVLHCTVALLALTMQGGAVQTPAPQLTEGQSEFHVFLGGQPAGREQVRIVRQDGGWVITSTGSVGRPGAAATTRLEVKYTADLHPTESRLEMSQGQRTMTVTTTYGGTTAVSEITQDATTNSKTDQVSARTTVLPNNFYGAYAVLAAKLAGATAGAELPVYITPQTEITLSVKGVTTGEIKGPAGTLATRRYEISFANPTGPLAGELTTDQQGRLVRLEIAAAGLSVVRADVATVSARTVPARNPNDADVTIPASGFTLAGTITAPASVGRQRRPAVILVAGSGPVDRDETVAGIPIFTQLAAALAERGFIVLRYDKRGVGQSGGRTERVTLDDYADDLVAAFRWMRDRRDVDRNRIAVVGHSEGGAVGMLAAARERRISSLVLLAAMGTTGAELILEQQRHLLATMQAPDDERREKIELQQRIQEAVTSGKWEGIDEELRNQADSTWFRSLLLFDPAKVMEDIRQPILILQPELDRQVPVHHGQRLAELGTGRDRKVATELAVLPGLNHLLVPAKTGEVSEYGALPDKNVSPEVAQRIVAFLR